MPNVAVGMATVADMSLGWVVIVVYSVVNGIAIVTDVKPLVLNHDGKGYAIV